MSYGGRMSVAMRDVLIMHLDGAAVPIAQCRVPGQPQISIALVERGWIKTDGREARALYTYITDEGRQALAGALGDWADALAMARLDQRMLGFLKKRGWPEAA